MSIIVKNSEELSFTGRMNSRATSARVLSVDKKAGSALLDTGNILPDGTQVLMHAPFSPTTIPSPGDTVPLNYPNVSPHAPVIGGGGQVGNSNHGQIIDNGGVMTIDDGDGSLRAGAVKILAGSNISINRVGNSFTINASGTLAGVDVGVGGGTAVGPEGVLNFISGTGQAGITAVNNSGGTPPRIDITVDGGVEVEDNGSVVGTRPIIDFEDTGTLIWTVTDDSGNNRIKVSGTAAGGGGGGSTDKALWPIVHTAIDYAVQTTDAIIVGNASSGTYKVKLPAGASGLDGKIFWIRNINNGAVNVTDSTGTTIFKTLVNGQDTLCFYHFNTPGYYFISTSGFNGQWQVVPLTGSGMGLTPVSTPTSPTLYPITRSGGAIIQLPAANHAFEMVFIVIDGSSSGWQIVTIAGDKLFGATSYSPPTAQYTKVRLLTDHVSPLGNYYSV